MKWTPIDKAKPKFKTEYLVESADLETACTGELEKSETTAKGIEHSFIVRTLEGYKSVKATHIAIIADPNAGE